MSDEPKFCRDCRHYFPGTPSDCHAPENSAVDLVTGNTISNRYDAVSNRQFEVRGCTKDGKWWEAKNGME